MIIQAYKIIGGKEAPQLSIFFVLAPNKAIRTHIYIVSLFKKPKETLEQKFFSARCAFIVDFWNGFDVPMTLSQHSVDASEFRLKCTRFQLNF